MSIEEKAIILRIKQVRKNYAGERGKALFAKALGISPSTYSYYERDRVPPVDVLWSISQVTGADICWLIAGEDGYKGSDFHTKIPPELLKNISALVQRDRQALVVLQAFVELLEQKSSLEKGLTHISDNKDRDVSVAKDGNIKSKAVSVEDNSASSWVPVLGRTAAGMVHLWSDTGSYLPGVTELVELIERHSQTRHRQIQPSVISSDPTMVGIPKLNAVQVSMIQLSEIREDGVCEFIDCAEIGRIYPDAFALRVDGDSMSPHICDGDIVVLSPSVIARDGATAVVKLRGQIGVTCKIIRRDGDRVHLIASNEKYETKVYKQDEQVWALSVLWRIRLQ